MLDIGKKLDTIAQLLAGAPPGPEDKFLFQKYVYCKEDYTSWVVSLLGDLGITYTQVDSLVNGLYEYRCECTNDQFNQLILKVELSTNPVLATYKKIDSFSDLIGINVFDMDSFAAGCDSRISKSATITEEAVKYWVNVQNDQIVQRQLDLAGSANIGTYSIDFTGGTVISGSVPVNGSIRDNILYRKKISGSGFDRSLSNCTIEGWIIDLKKRLGDISGEYTIEQGGATGINAYDDDLENPTAYYPFTANNWTVVFRVSFPSMSIDEVHLIVGMYSTVSNTSAYQVEAEVDGVWTHIFDESSPTTASERIRSTNNVGLAYSLVTGIRVSGWDVTSGTSYLRIYDLSVFK